MIGFHLQRHLMKFELDRCDVAFGLENVVLTAIASFRFLTYKTLVQWKQVARSDWLIFRIGEALFDICDLKFIQYMLLTQLEI